jgi:hypothetical protein
LPRGHAALTFVDLGVGFVDRVAVVVQRLEAIQIKFLRHLLGITKLDKEKTNVLGKKQEQRI